MHSAPGSGTDDVFDLTREELDALPYGVITLDRDGRVLRYSRGEAELAQRQAASTIGLQFFTDVAPCTNVAAFRGRFDAFAREWDSGSESFDFVFAFRWGLQPVSITFQRRSGRADINVLVRWPQLERTPMSAAAYPAVSEPSEFSIVLARPQYCTLGDRAEAELRARVHADDAAAVTQIVETASAARHAYAIEYRQVQADASVAVVQEYGTFPTERAQPGMAMVVDVTERRQAEYRHWHAAHHDQLTGLANARLLVDRIEAAVGEAQTNQRLAVVFVANVDRFREINASFGSEVGDELLKLLGWRLGEVARAGDTVARLGGDWFALLMTNVDERSSAEEVAQRLGAVAARPYTIGERSYFMPLSVGVSVAPHDATSGVELVRCADAAVRAARAAGRTGVCWYGRELSAETTAGAHLYNELRCALDRDEFELYYQPIYDVVHDRIVAVESLIRWNHPTRGLVMPGDFIETADGTGLIVPLGEWVLREACRQGRAWWDAGYELRVCVNVSVVQFQQPRFVELVGEILVESGMPPGHLELEMTESIMVAGFGPMIETLTRLKALGIRLAIDDFGTGYSSLAYLKYFPIDTLKIDRAFVTDIMLDRFDRAIATVVLTLATELGLNCVVEGAERREQVDLLIEVGCTLLQGYFFARPAPAHALPALLRASNGVLRADDDLQPSTR